MKCDAMISQECCALGFYDCETSASSIKPLFTSAIAWFTTLGYPPDKAGIEAPGFSGKLRKFSWCNSKLKKMGFNGVTYFELISSSPNGTTGFDYYLKAVWSVKYRNATLVVRSSLASFGEESLHAIVREWVHHLNPKYGIGFKRDHQAGPSYFISGIAADSLSRSGDPKDDQNVGQWYFAIEKQVWREGFIRDIYPWNFLTAFQLERRINGRSFNRWILEKPQRGTLQLVSDNVWLWKVDESEIRNVREALRNANLIWK